jgi:hypothetical protein
MLCTSGDAAQQHQPLLPKSESSGHPPASGPTSPTSPGKASDGSRASEEDAVVEASLHLASNELLKMTASIADQRDAFSHQLGQSQVGNLLLAAGPPACQGPPACPPGRPGGACIIPRPGRLQPHCAAGCGAPAAISYSPSPAPTPPHPTLCCRSWHPTSARRWWPRT